MSDLLKWYRVSYTGPTTKMVQAKNSLAAEIAVSVEHEDEWIAEAVEVEEGDLVQGD